MNPEIEYVSYGIGNLIDGKIYLNKNLRKYPRIHEKVYYHELQHLYGHRHIDWDEPFDFGLFVFVLTHPSAWMHYLPVWIFGKKVIYNKNLLMLWIFAIVWVVIIFFYARWIT